MGIPHAYTNIMSTSGYRCISATEHNQEIEPLAMELEIELTENVIAPSLTEQPNGHLRLSFHWKDDIRLVLEMVTHPLRSDFEDGFIELWSSEEASRNFQQMNESTVLIRSKQRD
jgi:hypothetical protein